jgi:hypothetical protein
VRANVFSLCELISHSHVLHAKPSQASFISLSPHPVFVMHVVYSPVNHLFRSDILYQHIAQSLDRLIIVALGKVFLHFSALTRMRGKSVRTTPHSSAGWAN